MNAPDLKIRKANQKDLNFIYDSFLKTIKHDTPIGKQMKTGDFMRQYREVLDHLFLETNCEIYIASYPEDPFTILGYIVYKLDVLHFIFVKLAFRNLGIGKALFERAFGRETIEYSHKTKSVASLCSKHPEHFFNPLHLYKRGNDYGETA